MENSPELMSSGRSGFTGFERGNSKLTRRRRVLELGTRGRPLEQSDRVNSGRVRAGWAGGRVGWTAQLKATLQSKNVLTNVFLPTVKLEV